MPCSPPEFTLEFDQNQNVLKSENFTQQYLLDAVIDARDRSEQLEKQLLIEKDNAQYWQKTAEILEHKEIEARNEMVMWRNLESVAMNRAKKMEKKITELSQERLDYENTRDIVLENMPLMYKLLEQMEQNIKNQKRKNEYHLNMARTLSLCQDQTDEWNVYQGQLIERLQKELKEAEDVNEEQKKVLREAEEKILELVKSQSSSTSLIYPFIIVIIICMVFKAFV